MPFNLPALTQGFLRVINNPPPSPTDTARIIANAYAEFVRPALGVGAPGAFTGTEAARMATIMASGFSPNGNPAAASNAIVNSVTAFWLTPPVIFGPNPVVSFGGGPVLLTCLKTLSNPQVKGPDAARKLANCFDKATRLVLVQPPVGPPVPIT